MCYTTFSASFASESKAIFRVANDIQSKYKASQKKNEYQVFAVFDFSSHFWLALLLFVVFML